MWFKTKQLIAALMLVLLTDADMTVPNEWVAAYQQHQTISMKMLIRQTS